MYICFIHSNISFNNAKWFSQAKHQQIILNWVWKKGEMALLICCCCGWSYVVSLSQRWWTWIRSEIWEVRICQRSKTKRKIEMQRKKNPTIVSSSKLSKRAWNNNDVVELILNSDDRVYVVICVAMCLKLRSLANDSWKFAERAINLIWKSFPVGRFNESA